MSNKILGVLSTLSIFFSCTAFAAPIATAISSPTSIAITSNPTKLPTIVPSVTSTIYPTLVPVITSTPTIQPTIAQTLAPTNTPSTTPTPSSTELTETPTAIPTAPCECISVPMDNIDCSSTVARESDSPTLRDYLRKAAIEVRSDLKKIVIESLADNSVESSKSKLVFSKNFKIGDEDSEVIMIRRLLQQIYNDDYGDSPIYDAYLAEDVRHFKNLYYDQTLLLAGFTKANNKWDSVVRALANDLLGNSQTVLINGMRIRPDADAKISEIKDLINSKYFARKKSLARKIKTRGKVKKPSPNKPPARATPKPAEKYNRICKPEISDSDYSYYDKNDPDFHYNQYAATGWKSPFKNGVFGVQVSICWRGEEEPGKRNITYGIYAPSCPSEKVRGAAHSILSDIVLKLFRLRK